MAVSIFLAGCMVINSRVERSVDIRPLRAFALEKLPKDLMLRDFLLTEPDELPVEEFLSRLSVWIRLLKVGGDWHGRRSDQ